MNTFSKKSPFIIIDGIDGSGKSTITNIVIEEFAKQNLSIFSIPAWSKTNHNLPNLNDCIDADIIVSAEPTHTWIGAAIREELIQQNRKWDGKIIANAFSLDRLILYKRLIIPLRDAGKIIIKDRSVSTSLVYQPIQENTLSLEDVMNLTGNRLALLNPPDLLIIASCRPENAIERLQKRTGKNDNAIFEKLDFLERTNERFHSEWFKKIWEDRGTKVVYFDANKPIEEMTINARELARKITLIQVHN